MSLHGHCGIINTLSQPVIIDTEKGIIDFGDDPVVIASGIYYGLSSLFPNNPEYYREVSYSTDYLSGANLIVFNARTCKLYAKSVVNENILDEEAVLGEVRLIYSTKEFVSCNFPFRYLILNNKLNIRKDDIKLYTSGNSNRRAILNYPIPLDGVQYIAYKMTSGWSGKATRL